MLKQELKVNSDELYSLYLQLDLVQDVFGSNARDNIVMAACHGKTDLDSLLLSELPLIKMLILEQLEKLEAAADDAEREQAYAHTARFE